ncbi:acyltransferase [Deinococcus sp. YIM 134068]|uniref:acyltransferase family protein n=1 Tax=Deinococcus lichenicola TaxID=3118910 RepID=UPI002F93865B
MSSPYSGQFPLLRSPGLDGVRGLAALAVVFSHVATLTYVPWGPRLPTPAEFTLWYLGAPAVDLFFVLSGYVVARSLLRRPAVRPYLARRVVRLAPLAYLAVGLAVLTRFAASHASDDFSVLITRDLRAPLTPQDLLGALTLSFPALNANHLNPPLWTLIVEMQVALLMPLFTRLARWPWTLPVVWFLCLVAATLGWVQAAYFPLFFLGSVLAAQRWTLPRWAVVPALLAGLAVLLQRHVTGSDEVVTRYLTAPGAALVILTIMGGGARRFLEAPPVQWLGEVSYSLYAVHFPVLLALSVLGTRAGLNLSACGLLAVPLCLLMAAVTQRWVERPLLNVLRRAPRPHPLAAP